MKILNIHKKLLSLLLALALTAAVCAAPALAAEANFITGDLPDSLYLVQSRSGACTLASAAMMVRSLLYRNGCADWAQATERDVEYDAWCADGLYWSWTYDLGSAWVSVAHESVGGLSLGELEDILAAHPEGIVLYCGNLPHAVFITGCYGETVWCADPVYGYETTLADSYLGAYGGQDSILRNVTAIWYVSDWSI